MNIVAMAVVALVVFAEKALPWCRLTSRATAVALVAYGAAVIVAPHILDHS
jgi:predicted metal-binding membrane protein